MFSVVLSIILLIRLRCGNKIEIYEYINKRYGGDVKNSVRQYENISKKLEKNKLDLDFLIKCKTYHVFPKYQAPVFYKLKDEIRLNLFQYGLVPSWSKEAKLKFSTHNARIESVGEKPTWKRPFLSMHCVVPVSQFMEPIREGDYAGNEVSFKRKDRKLLFAAGIFDLWKSAENKIRSFAILTKEASDFVRKVGHQREPVFIDQNSIQSWLSHSDSLKDTIEVLRNCNIENDYTVTTIRELKSK